MAFFADLHIHSKYSRATARDLDFENIFHAARIKGITVVGTGDFTHPAWVEEMAAKLEPAEPGLFALKKEVAAKMADTLPGSCRNPVRFMLQAEISNIYKKAGRVRKNHNIIYLPDLASVKKFNARLDAIGNITSDGRPILGLDARDLLEIMLEVNDQGFLVPAHIWTPWFSLLGSKSGFDCIEECFEDLTPHIFAVETGLSSDPPMNWRVADLDTVRLMSNSDAHSPGYLGRNACVFNTDLDYFAMRKSLESLDLAGYLGTLDMYPDQGKYHYDGHRKCGVSLDPDDTARRGGICPVCGRPLTLGVLYRVRELATRPQGFVPEHRQGFTSIIPLADMLSEILGAGPKSKKVIRYYHKAVQALGPELAILTDRSCGQIQAAGMPLLAEAVKRMRAGSVHVSPGFDGEYGRVRVFTPEELLRYKGERQLQMTLGGTPIDEIPARRPVPEKPADSHPAPPKGAPAQKTATSGPGGDGRNILEGLNSSQLQAVTSPSSAILITAGPGTGKTRTLTARIAHLVTRKQVAADRILALTFTNKAAGELLDRIQSLLPRGGPQVTAATFHGFCLAMLREYEGLTSRLLEDDVRKELVKAALGQTGKKPAGMARLTDALDLQISLCKQQLLGPEDELPGSGPEDRLRLKTVYAAYQQLLQNRDGIDFEDLIFRFYRLLLGSDRILKQVQSRFSHIFVDEYQDLNLGQYRLVKLLAKNSHLFVIGDPDQSIYGFRGSDHRFFDRFAADYPSCEQIGLTRNYRSAQTILDAAVQMISRSRPDREALEIFSGIHGTEKLIIKETATETAEAVAVGRIIEAGVGGLSLDIMNTRHGEDFKDSAYGFCDFAVLYRTRRQGEVFAKVFEKHGIPFQTADRKAGFSRTGIAPLLSCFRLMTGRWGEKDVQALDAHFNHGTQGHALHPADRILGPVKDQVRKRAARECLGVFTRFLGIEETVAKDPASAAAYTRIQDLAAAFEDPEAFMDSLALDQDPDHLVNAAQKVSLLTMHAAKGLEFPVVFITGCEQGLIPFAREKEVCQNPAEERRLFYVAMTRAMDLLCLSYARKRQIFGSSRDRQPSVFLDDIAAQLVRLERMSRTFPEKKQPVQLELF